jgi:hypothetical protein
MTQKPEEHQRDLLGQALGEVLVAAGMIRADAHMTGPQLLLAASDFVRSVAALTLPPVPGVDRERVARIIDPLPFDDGPTGWIGMPATRGFRQNEALAKADAILALVSPLEGKGNGASCTESTDAPCSASSAAAEDGQRKSEDKANHDCLAKRRDGEPMFILLGRDPDAHNIVRFWAERRLAAGGDPEHCQMGLNSSERMKLYAADPANAPASAPPASAYPPALNPRRELWWVGTCQPDRRAGTAVLTLDWPEFEALRRVAGLKPYGRTPSAEAPSIPDSSCKSEGE